MEMRMVRWMCGVLLRDRVPWERMGIESVSDAVKWNRLRWLGYVLRKDDDDWGKKIMLFEVEGKRGWGRLRMTWSQVVEKDMRECRLKREDAKDRERWRRLLCRAASQPHVSRENGHKTTVVCVVYIIAIDFLMNKPVYLVKDSDCRIRLKPEVFIAL